MSAFDTAALPGKIPTCGPGANVVTPDSLFKSNAEKEAYANIVNGVNGDVPEFKVKKVRVEIFDLSDPSQRKKYEKLWAELLVKTSKLEAVVETSKDLVHRPDGTSYWMKYVEYVEFSNSMYPKKDGRSKR